MSEQSGDPKILLEHVTKALVDAPDQVSVSQIEEEGEIVLELTVAENDLGKVIGKSGRTARALRTLLSAAGIKAQKRYALEIVEEGAGLDLRVARSRRARDSRQA